MTHSAFFLLFLCAAPVAPTKTSPSAKLQQSIQQSLQPFGNVKTLVATVDQEKTISLLEEPVHTVGQLLFQRPNKLRMDFQGPNGTTLLIDGATMTMHYKALKKTETYSLAGNVRSQAMAEHLFLRLNPDTKRLSAIYELTIQKRDPLVLVLTPKAPALRKHIASIRVKINPKGYVSLLELNEANNDTTKWTFTKTVLNSTIQSSLFESPSLTP